MPIRRRNTTNNVSAEDTRREYINKLIEEADRHSAQPEFARVPEVNRLFGLKRGTVYNLLALQKIRGVLLRARGSKSGVRLIDLDSVRAYIRECQEAA